MINRRFGIGLHICVLLFAGMAPNALIAQPVSSPAPSSSESSSAADDYAISDKEITFAIEAKFLVDPEVPENAIEVKTQDGIVTLSGTVNTLLGKDRAKDIVRTVRGVEAIIDTIEVVPDPRVDDDVLRAQVESALARDPVTEKFEVNVTARDGVVILDGTVDSWQEKQLSGQVAKSVKGIVKLDNRLDVLPDAVRPDSEIEVEVRKQLQTDVWVDGKFIGVMVDGGKVTLTGRVGSLAEKYSAFTDAWVPGVISVNVDPLEIDWKARDEMRRDPADLFRTSEQIQQALHRVWKYDPRVKTSQIMAEIDNGIVTLTGVVTDLRAKRAAEEDAENAIGVFRVHNFLKVRPASTASDDQLQEWVRKALAQNALLDRYEIKVSVNDGTVYLDGYVETLFEVKQAIHTAEDVKGVRKVVSRLEHEAVSTNGKSDEEIWYDIMQSIWWDPRLYQEEIHAKVAGGEVTLTGTVFSIQDLQKLTQIARESGAIKVHNRVKVKHAPDFYSAKKELDAPVRPSPMTFLEN
jgi:osmotically-inducible protein OsmY